MDEQNEVTTSERICLQYTTAFGFILFSMYHTLIKGISRQTGKNKTMLLLWRLYLFPPHNNPMIEVL